MPYFIYNGLAKSESTAIPNTDKDKEREAPRKASPRSEENSGQTRKMNLYNPQSHLGQVSQTTTYPGPEGDT